MGKRRYKGKKFSIPSQVGIFLDRTNKILALLTIVFTFSIPVTIVGTFFGMNINMPGTINNPWTFWGPYTTLIIVLIASIAPVILMYIAFKRLRWL